MICLQLTQIASSESFFGPNFSKVVAANTGAESNFIVSRTPSMMTRRSKGCVKNWGSIIGGSAGFGERSVTVPLLWGFMIRQMAPKYAVLGAGSYDKKDGGVCYLNLRQLY